MSNTLVLLAAARQHQCAPCDAGHRARRISLRTGRYALIFARLQ